jgi:methionyl aminopeptidase
MTYGERIPIKTRREIEVMREASRQVGEILLELRELVAPGVTTGELDRHAEKAIAERGVVSSFKGYEHRGLPRYPAVLCVSVNDEVVHGIPGPRELEEGDVLSMDFGVAVDGLHGDSAVTVPVGGIGSEEQRLLDVTRDALWCGIEVMVPGNRLSDIGSLHEPPWVPNYGKPGKGPRLMPGMVLAIEPMVDAGGPDIRMCDNGWTAVTADGSLSAHFEHTILITEGEPEPLTRVAGSH